MVDDNIDLSKAEEKRGSWFGGRFAHSSRETQHLMTRVSFGNSIHSVGG